MYLRRESLFQPLQGRETPGKRCNGSLLCLWMTNPRNSLTVSSQGYHSKPAREPSPCHTTMVAGQPAPQGEVYFWIWVSLSRAMIPAPVARQHPRLLPAWDHPGSLDESSFQRQARLPTAIVLWLSAYFSPSLSLLPASISSEALNFV